MIFNATKTTYCPLERTSLEKGKVEFLALIPDFEMALAWYDSDLTRENVRIA